MGCNLGVFESCDLIHSYGDVYIQHMTIIITVCVNYFYAANDGVGVQQSVGRDQHFKSKVDLYFKNEMFVLNDSLYPSAEGNQTAKHSSEDEQHSSVDGNHESVDTDTSIDYVSHTRESLLIYNNCGVDY